MWCQRIAVNRMARRRVLLAGVGAVGLLVGCQDPEHITGARDGLTPRSAANAAVRPAEAEFMAIALEIPSFGGYYIDESGALVGAVVNASDQRGIASRLDAVAEKIDRLTKSGVRSKGIRTVVVNYTFPELASWRDIASSEVLGKVSGVVSTDADEVHNRLTLGVLAADAEAAEREALERLQQLGVPRMAVKFERTAQDVAYGTGVPALRSAIARPALRVTPPEGYTTLRNTAVPFLGGIGVDPVFAGLNCTATLGVDYAGSRHMLVASHCTNVTYGFDGHVFSQADGSRIGAEDVDPRWNTTLNGYPGRQSDAALASVDGAVQFRRGAIARPTGRNAGGGSGGDGPLTINQSRPFLSVLGVTGGNLAGQTIQKVGQTTGWTYGKTTQTCTDVLGTDGYWRFCSFRVDMVSRGGDSGSPGFLWDGEDAAWYTGPLWGGNGSSTVFSYHSGFTDELGQGSGAITYISDITVGYPNTSGSTIINGTMPSLRWTAVSTANTTYTTEYIVTKVRCQAYGSCTYPMQVYRGTGLRYDDYVERYARVAGNCPSYAPRIEYTIEARNMGVRSPAGFCYELYQY